jgi:hypothetical protein
LWWFYRVGLEGVLGHCGRLFGLGLFLGLGFLGVGVKRGGWGRMPRGLRSFYGGLLEGWFFGSGFLAAIGRAPKSEGRCRSGGWAARLRSGGEGWQSDRAPKSEGAAGPPGERPAGERPTVGWGAERNKLKKRV